MSTIAGVVTDEAAQAPFRIFEFDGDLDAARRCAKADVIVVDVKHLAEGGVTTEAILLRELTRLFGRVPSGADLPEQVDELAHALIAGEARVVLLVNPDE